MSRYIGRARDGLLENVRHPAPRCIPIANARLLAPTGDSLRAHNAIVLLLIKAIFYIYHSTLGRVRQYVVQKD